MDTVLTAIAPELAPISTLLLLGSSFLGSFISASFGLGGGVFLLAVMASLMPPLALIPVHGAVQIGSNFMRMCVLARYVQLQAVLPFAVGSLAGVIIGGLVVVEIPPGLIQTGIGLFVLWNIFFRPPAWLGQNAGLIGGISSFLTMFFGATGVFVATFIKSLKLDRVEHTATHAAFMSLQHLLKIGTFFALGFAFSQWLPLIAAMISFGFLGTLVGRKVLFRMTNVGFKRALDVVLILMSFKLIIGGLTS